MTEKTATIVSAVVAALSLLLNIGLGIYSFQVNSANRALEERVAFTENRPSLHFSYYSLSGSDFLKLFDDPEGLKQLSGIQTAQIYLNEVGKAFRKKAEDDVKAVSQDVIQVLLIANLDSTSARTARVHFPQGTQDIGSLQGDTGLLIPLRVVEAGSLNVLTSDAPTSVSYENTTEFGTVTETIDIPAPRVETWVPHVAALFGIGQANTKGNDHPLNLLNDR